MGDKREAQPLALVVCARSAVIEAVGAALRGINAPVDVCRPGEAARKALARTSYALVCLDANGPSWEEFARQLVEAAPACKLLLFEEPLRVETVQAALRLGAFDCVAEAQLPERACRLAAEFLAGPRLPIPSKLLDGSAGPWRCEGLITSTHAMRRVLRDLRAVALSDTPVFLSGESGVGKSRCAEVLHTLSGRAPLVTVGCVGLAAEDLDAALFEFPTGDEPLSKSVPSPSRSLHQARGGTLVLDEVAALDTEAQAQLVRALSASLPVGPHAGSPARRRLSKPRIVCTTHANIQSLVRRGAFRRDLFNRLAVVRIEIPPLRDRRADVPLLAAQILAERAQALGRGAGFALRASANETLSHHPWPGNVAELRNVLWHAALRTQSGEIHLSDMADLLANKSSSLGRIEIPIGLSLASAEREVVLQTLASFGSNKKRTAETLGIARRTLYLKLEEYKASAGAVSL